MSGPTDGIQGNLCLSSLYLVNYTNTVLKMIIFCRVLPPCDCNDGEAKEVKSDPNI